VPRAKRIFTIFSALIIVIGGGLLWHSHTVNKAQNKEFNLIAEPMIRDLVSSKWSTNAVYKYASPRLKKRMDKSPIVMEGPRATPSWTGNVKEYEGVRRVQIDMTHNIASVTSEVYFDYNNIFTYPPCGASYVTLLLYKNDDKWSLDGFAIDSPVSELYMYGFVEDLRLAPIEEIFLDLRWFTGNNSLRPGCLLPWPHSF
jgi:hypothetical protein